MLEQALTVALIERNDDLAIAMGQKALATSLKIGAQLAVVVDLAVADQPY